MNDIPASFRKTGATWMFSTPSVASTLTPKSIPSLKCLTIGGEAISLAHIMKWEGKICLMEAYGPTETSVIASSNTLLDEDGNKIETDSSNIGKGLASQFWIVDPRDHDKLMPIGSAGELVIEGQVVAREYLNNKQKSADVFVRNSA
jgi:non-ribosomal peptide synthetase component F